MQKNSINIDKSKILIAGFTFKSDCSDIRNTKVLEIYKYLKKRVNKVDVYDPFVSKDYLFFKNRIHLNLNPKKNYYDGVIVCVDHTIFKRKGVKFFKNFLKKNSFIFDVKNIFKKKDSDLSL